MTCKHESADLLPFYASGTLDDGRRRKVDQHLQECEECRTDLAFWREVGAAIIDANQELAVPSQTVLMSALGQVRHAESAPLTWAWQLLRSQLLLIRREIWPACAIVMTLGYLVATVGTGEARASIVVALAPLVAAASIAMLYGPENDPAIELALATPTSPCHLLLARLALVFGYDLLLALAASLGIVGVASPESLGTIILGWLGPMTFLSALALVLSLRLGPTPAIAGSFSLWLARWLVSGQVDLPGATGLGVLEVPARVCAEGWANTAMLLALSCGLLALALWSTARGEPLGRLSSD